MPFTIRAAVIALTVAFGSSSVASAGWNNVFQTTCQGCKPSRSSFFAPAPQPCCPSVSYQQRCYTQAYTAYRMETKYEPVTTYYRSYYYEPVTSYSYTSYYDPCTGCCQRVAVPTTSYRMKSKCNAVQSYVQRCQMVPYTAYRTSYYMEPVVTYSNPCCDNNNGPVISNPGVVEGGSNVGPNGLRPAVQEDERIAPQGLPQNRFYTPPSNNNNNNPPMKMDRIGKLNEVAILQGTIVNDDRITPRGNAKLTFASAQNDKTQITAVADPTGRFNIDLPAGEWKMYVSGTNGQAAYHSVVSVKARDQRFVTVVSR